MTSGLLPRRIAIAAAGTALAAMGALTACSPTTEKEAPTSTTTVTSAPSATSSSLTPSEKAVGPGITNSFSPSVRAGQPGAVCQQLVNGVCVR
ncbi:MAG: hypothetical protein ACKOQ4_08025 [Mycobacterium sp.]